MRHDGWTVRGAFGAIGLLLIANVARPATAPMSDQAVLMRVEELNQSAAREIERRRFDRARAYLLDAERSAKQRVGVVSGAVLARTYILLGALEITSGGDGERAKHQFRRALCRDRYVRPDEPINSPDVDGAFEAAKAQVTKQPPICRLVARLQRSRSAPEPELPARIQALDCPNADEALAGAGLALRCALNERLPVAKLKLFYRPPGSDAFVSVDMARSARGWWTGVIPAKDVTGKALAYYFEGQNAAGKAVVRNGEADSPNFALLLSPAESCYCD
jgi:hypothetical protein